MWTLLLVYRPQGVARKGDKVVTGARSEETFMLSVMDGPSFHCAYLGFSAISKPPTNISVIQNPIKDLYFQYRKTPATGRSANLKLIQNGVLVTLFENGAVKAEMFFEFPSVTFVEAAKFLPIKTSSEKKPKAIFVPVDESRGAVSDKNAFSLDKSFHFLVSSSHPPLVVCVVRRPTGVKALDCHVFALDTIENALHIAALIGSTQMPPGVMNKVDPGVDTARLKGNFDRNVRGDVIRADHGEYSVYKGPHSYETHPVHEYSGGPISDVHSGHRYTDGPIQGPIRNGDKMHPLGAGQGPIVLTQDIFRGAPMASQQQYGLAHGPEGYGMYEQSTYGGPPGAGYMRQHEVLVHTPHRPEDTNSSGSQVLAGDVRMRFEDVNMRNHANQRLSGAPASVPAAGPVNRFSVGQMPTGGRVPQRPSEVTQGMNAPHRQSEPLPSSVSPFGGMVSPRSPPVFSPTSPRGFDVRDGEAAVFSASNLESRGNDGGSEPQPQIGGRPVAKVPPHMKGVKVLPSDFRMVKLKPKVEKRSDASDDVGYDNKEIMDTHKQLQDYESNPSFAGGMMISSAKTGHQDADGFRDFFQQSKIRQEEHNRDFLPMWNETVRNSKVTGGGHHGMGYDSPNDSHSYGGPRDSSHYQENNKYSGPHYNRDNQVGDNHRPHPSYTTDINGDPHVKTKDLEIANMFSNIRLQGGSNNQNMYRQLPGHRRTEIE